MIIAIVMVAPWPSIAVVTVARVVFGLGWPSIAVVTAARVVFGLSLQFRWQL
jgi:hypothetical protein